MSMLNDVEELKKPAVEITVTGASFELKFVPGTGTVINHNGLVYVVTDVEVTLSDTDDEDGPARVLVTVS